MFYYYYFFNILKITAVIIIMIIICFTVTNIMIVVSFITILFSILFHFLVNSTILSLWLVLLVSLWVVSSLFVLHFSQYYYNIISSIINIISSIINIINIISSNSSGITISSLNLMQRRDTGKLVVIYSWVWNRELST